MLRRLSARLEGHSDLAFLERAVTSILQCMRRGRESLCARFGARARDQDAGLRSFMGTRARNLDLAPIDDTECGPPSLRMRLPRMIGETRRR